MGTPPRRSPARLWRHGGGGRRFPRGSVTHSPLPLSWLAPPPLVSGVKTLPPVGWAGPVDRLAGLILLGCGSRGASSGKKECGVR